MCGRFTLGSSEKIKKRFNTVNNPPFLKASWNMAPNQSIAVIRKNSPNRISMMRWGFLFSRNSKAGVINIRSETTMEKPYFKNFLLHKRCIIPVDGFYEWGTLNLEGKEEKYPFYFFLKKEGLFGLAGLYNDFADNQGNPFYSCAILTCPANDLVKKIHQRMPVVLRKSDEKDWLDLKIKNLKILSGILKPYSTKEMSVSVVSRRVNNPINDGKDLIKPYKIGKKAQYFYG